MAADMEAANMAGGGGRVVPAHPHPHPPPHPLYMPHLAIKPPHPTLGIFTQLEKIMSFVFVLGKPSKKKYGIL